MKLTRNIDGTYNLTIGDQSWLGLTADRALQVIVEAGI